MKLATFLHNGQPSVGAVIDEGVVDLNANDERPMFADLKSLIAEGLAGVQRAEVAVVARQYAPGCIVPFDKVKWLPPIPNPSKILAIGLNYRDHCAEQGLEVPTTVTLFNKLPSSLIASGAPIVLPPAELSSKVDYEAELAVVIGRGGRDIPVEEALEHVGGYTCCNDVSARDLQFADGGRQWLRGKSLDTFCPIGPWIVTPDEIKDPGALPIQSVLNGQVMQSSNTSNLVFDVPHLIAELSRGITLQPGDIISTGTPGGVGQSRKPPVWLASGDVITVRITGIGELTNRVIATS